MSFVGVPRPRALSTFLAFIVVPRIAIFATLAGALLVGQAMAVDPLAAPADDHVTELPTWTAADRAAYPDCVREGDWTPGAPAASVVVRGSNAPMGSRMPFDAAWEVNHNDLSTDDVWVVGICR